MLRRRRYLLNTFILSRSGGFSPRSLFAAGEVGAWYDPSDLTTLYQDAAGTTPVTTPGQVVGLMLDKSRGLVLGSELVANGDFSNGTTGWLGTTSVIANGVASWTGSSSVIEIYRPENLFVSDKTYSITGDVTRFVAKGSFFIRVAGLDISAPISGVGKFSLIVTAPNNGSLNIISYGGANLDIDKISVRELPGNHATQSGATSVRPIYAVEPATGRRNLLTYTEQFDNATWVPANSSITANAALAPDGTTTAEKLLDSAAASVHSAYQNITVNPSTAYTLSFYAKASGRNWVTLDPVYPDVANNITYFDLVNGTFGTSDTDNTNVIITSVGGGWYRCSLTHTTAVGQTSMRFQIAPANANNSISYAGNGTDGVLIWGAQLEVGSTATAYQRVVSQYDVTESGVPSLHYLAFDGVDDWLQTSTITPGTDKVQIFAGVRKLSDAAIGAVTELSADPNANTGSFWLLSRVAIGNYSFASRGASGGVQVASSPASFPAPITNLLTGLGDIAGDIATLRVNGTQVAQATTDQGTGNYLAYPLYIGCRGGSTLPFNGNLYGLIVRFGANLSASQIAAAERWMAQRTGVTLA